MAHPSREGAADGSAGQTSYTGSCGGKGAGGGREGGMHHEKYVVLNHLHASKHPSSSGPSHARPRRLMKPTANQEDAQA